MLYLKPATILSGLAALAKDEQKQSKNVDVHKHAVHIQTLIQ